MGIAYYCAVSVLENKTKSKSIISISNILYRSPSIPFTAPNPAPHLSLVHTLQFLFITKLQPNPLNSLLHNNPTRYLDLLILL